MAATILLAGIWSGSRLSLDVTPDISNVQVQVLTPVPNLSPEEIETSVTRPIELEMLGLPHLEQVRSLTRFGISQVCLILSDGTDLYQARQMVSERLAQAVGRIPRGLSPALAPPSSGLGEVFTYVLIYRQPDGDTNSVESRLRRLKLVQEFVVKPCLKSIQGVAEVNTTGGYDQQLVVEVDPVKLAPLGLDLNDVAGVVEKNAAIGGGALVDRDGNQLIIRSRSRAQTISELSNISIKLSWGAAPIPLSSVATVSIGSNIRLGAATFNGEEAVLGTAMMLTGQNARAVALSLRDALPALQSRLPSDMEIRPLYDRAELVNVVIGTVRNNLLMAGGLVVAVLLLFLRSWHAAFIVTSLLVLSFALGLTGMAAFGIMGSLLTLGAIDFGVVVDDTIVMVENVARRMSGLAQCSATVQPNSLAVIVDACCQVRKPMLVGMLLIIGAYLPVLTLSGVEGRMFRPLAEAVILVLLSSLLLTITIIPGFCALSLGRLQSLREPRFMQSLRSFYERVFLACRRRWAVVLALTLLLAVGAILVVMRLGADFMPALDEGWLVVEVQRDPRIDLVKSLSMELATERAIQAEVPEVRELFARIGMSEIATDPQGANQNDIYVNFRPRPQWRQIDGRTASKAELAELIKSAIERNVPGQDLELNQPIALRFDELLEGVRTAVAVKVFGPDYDQLDSLAAQIAGIARNLQGVDEVLVDQSGRTETMEFRPDRDLMLRYMATADQVNNAVSIGLAGREVGRIDDGDLFYPLVVRIPNSMRNAPETLNTLPLRAADGSLILGLGNVGSWQETSHVAAITREQAERREAVLISVRNADVVGFVARLRDVVHKRIQLAEGYRLEFGGAYQNWRTGSHRIAEAGMLYGVLAVLLVYAALRNWRQTGLVVVGIPFAMVGGIWGLWLRNLPLTMPAAVGFVTLGGLGVLNGLVLMTRYNQLRQQGVAAVEAALNSAKTRLRPVLMTALVTSVGFVPMALSNGQGAELQRPFATVVIFGILTSTTLTLLLIPLFLSGDKSAFSPDGNRDPSPRYSAET